MKKITTLTIFIILFTNINAQLIKTTGSIEFGYFKDRVSINNNGWQNYYENKNNIFAEIMLDFSIRKLHYQTILFNTFGSEMDGFTFSVGDIYYISKLYFKFTKIEFGAEHGCLHPLINENYGINYGLTSTRSGSFDKIYFKYNF